MTKFFLFFLKKSDFLTFKFVLPTVHCVRLCGFFAVLLLILVTIYSKKVAKKLMRGARVRPVGNIGGKDGVSMGLGAYGRDCGKVGRGRTVCGIGKKENGRSWPRKAKLPLNSRCLTLFTKTKPLQGSWHIFEYQLLATLKTAFAGDATIFSL